MPSFVSPFVIYLQIDAMSFKVAEIQFYPSMEIHVVRSTRCVTQIRVKLDKDPIHMRVSGYEIVGVFKLLFEH